MKEQYTTTIAKHYASFRPPLHRLILNRMVRPLESFQNGLDMGCGTGYSTIALIEYCERVFGLDLNQAMLDEAEQHPRIHYICGDGAYGIGLIPVQAFDVVTFAGSLFYMKTDKLRSELARVCKPNGSVFVYDFEVLLDAILNEIGVDCPPVRSDYDHSINLSDWSEFSAEKVGSDRVEIELSEKELAHVLLADSNRFQAFLKKFPNSADNDPFASLVDCLKFNGSKHGLEAEIYFARYQK